jgi:hypothetical protein
MAAQRLHRLRDAQLHAADLQVGPAVVLAAVVVGVHAGDPCGQNHAPEDLWQHVLQHRHALVDAVGVGAVAAGVAQDFLDRRQ